MPFRRSLSAIPLLLVVLSSTPAFAGRSKVDDWNTRLQSVLERVKRGEFAPARKDADGLLNDMMDRLDPTSKNAAHAFGLVLLARGLAEAGLGHEREAAWDFQVAQQIDPPLESWDLAEFGATGEILVRHRLDADPQPEIPDSEELERQGAKLPARVDDGSQPKMPRSIPFPPERDYLTIISFAIDSSGVATHPRIEVNDPHPGFVIAVLDFLRNARFEPAKLGGKAFEAGSTFSLRFKAGVEIDWRRRPRAPGANRP